jgi:hypothetical protein
MIIRADTLDGRKAKIYDKHGKPVTLTIIEYNTDSQEARYCVKEEVDGKIRLVVDKTDIDNPQVLIKTILIEGSYAEIDGQRV